MKHLICACLFSTVFVLSLKDVKGQDETTPECHENLNGEYNGKHRWRIQTLRSEKDTLAEEINEKSPTTTSSVKVIGDYFESLRELHSRTEDPICRSDGDVIAHRALFFGFGTTEGCTTLYDQFGTQNSSEASEIASASKRLIESIEDLNKTLGDVGLDVVKSYDLPWDTARGNEIYPVTDTRIVTIRKCRAYRAIGYRVNGTWGIGASIYKYPWDYNAADWNRSFVTEFLTVKNDSLSQHKFWSPVCNDKLSATDWVQGTAIEEGGVGTVRWNHGEGKTEFIEEHYGLIDALGASEKQKEILQDSGTLSNIAVLLLPGALTLFPIGFFQEVSLGTVIMYSIATDVVSVLPVLIKGIEMVFYGGQKYYGLVAEVTGSAQVNELGVAQVYPAVCEFQSWIKNLGIGLICLALFLMILGVSLEFISLWYAKRRRLQDEEGVQVGLLGFMNRKETKE